MPGRALKDASTAIQRILKKKSINCIPPKRQITGKYAHDIERIIAILSELSKNDIGRLIFKSKTLLYLLKGYIATSESSDLPDKIKSQIDRLSTKRGVGMRGAQDLPTQPLPDQEDEEDCELDPKEESDESKEGWVDLGDEADLEPDAEGVHSPAEPLGDWDTLNQELDAIPAGAAAAQVEPGLDAAHDANTAPLTPPLSPVEETHNSTGSTHDHFNPITIIEPGLFGLPSQSGSL